MKPTRKSERQMMRKKVLSYALPPEENEESQTNETDESYTVKEVLPRKRSRKQKSKPITRLMKTRSKAKTKIGRVKASVVKGKAPSEKKKLIHRVLDGRVRKITKSKVTNIAVSLGIEKAPKRLTRAQQRKLNEEELQEVRYNEDLRRIGTLEELIRESNVEANIGSDDDSVGGDNAYMEVSEDEDINGGDENGESLCPRPLPKRTRGGNKSLRRNNRNDEVSQEEVKEMCMIIKSSISRKSLTASTSNSSAVQDDDLDAGISGNNKAEARTSSFFVHRSLRQVLGVQNQWLIENVENQGAVPQKTLRQLCTYHAPKHGFAKQLFIEHLSWLCIVSFSNNRRESIQSNNGLLAWIPSFQKKFASRYPQLHQDATPGSCTELDLVLKMTCLKASAIMSKILGVLLTTRCAFQELIKHVYKVHQDKRAICADFEVVHENLNVRSARFDESSVWGLKPIRLALEPPYLKTEDGLMAYPMTDDALSRITKFGCCFFKRDKQKWTTKDLQQLKICIKEALYSKRLSSLGDRYEVLMADCIRKYHEDMASEGRFDASPFGQSKRRRGRPKKSELEYSSKFGIIHPVIAVLPNGITIRNQVTPRLLAEWRANEERNLKVKTYEELVLLEGERIDWATVANKMVVKSRKHRTSEDCELAWRHEVHPRVNDKRWSVEESRRLKEIFHRVGNDWFAIAQELNAPTDNAPEKPGRTPYQCYFRIRNRLDPPKKLCWNDELDNHVLEKLKQFPGNWRLVAASIDDPAATKRQVIERYKKTINPVLRNGAFTRVEDCLLLLTIEKLKPFLAREGHFGCLLSYLPWRCETTWRDRANNLFSDWIVPWTLEEDKMLLVLAKTMNRNWQKISEEFTSFKNRKGCLTRYKILMRRLKDPRFNNSLEAYHEAYAMTRYNVFQYKHLKEILELLTRVQRNPLPEEHQHFVGLLRDKEPTEVRLQHMLLTFDKVILDSTIRSLTRYVKTRDNYWKSWISKHGKRKRTFDRRTFHPENPQSVASALHIRGLELKPKQEIPNLSDFEDEIYKYYARFKRTKALKQTAERPYIPDAKTLAQWADVSRLIQTSVDELEDVPLKRKWKALKAAGPTVHSAANLTKAKKVGKLLAKSKPVAKKKQRKERVVGVNKEKGKRARAPKRTKDRTNDNDSNEGGYILIPPEPDIKGTMKRGRPSRKNEDADPEFYVTPREKTKRNVEIQVNAKARRSARNTGVPKKTFEDIDFEDEDDFYNLEC